MDDLKRVNRKFLGTIFGFVVYILGVTYLIWESYLLFSKSSYAYALTFAILLITLFVISLFRAKLDAIINMSYLVKIRKNAGEPLVIKRLKSKEFLHTYLINNNYIMFAKDVSYVMYYKVEKDHIKKMLRNYILEIVVYINDSENEFYLEIVDEQIQKLQEMLRKEKKKVEKLLITQFKAVDELNEQTKESIKEIVFIRSQSGIISTINVGLHYESNLAVLLYSDTYSPSLYYAYQVAEIKKMI